MIKLIALGALIALTIWDTILARKCAEMEEELCEWMYKGWRDNDEGRTTDTSCECMEIGQSEKKEERSEA